MADDKKNIGPGAEKPGDALQEEKTEHAPSVGEKSIKV